MFFYRYTSRPARYGAVLAHTLREALDNVTVDLSGVEETLADQVAALSQRIEAIESKLLDYDESVNETAEPEPKPKAKQTAKRSGATQRKPRAKKSG